MMFLSHDVVPELMGTQNHQEGKGKGNALPDHPRMFQRIDALLESSARRVVISVIRKRAIFKKGSLPVFSSIKKERGSL